MYAQAMDKARKEGRIQGDKFAFQEGDNKIRLVSEAVLHESEYQGKPTRKWVLYVIDVVMVRPNSASWPIRLWA